MVRKNLTKRRLSYLFLLVFISLLIYWGGTKFRTEDITSFIQKSGIWAPLVFIILTTLTYVIAPLSGTPLWFVGWLLFGKEFQIYTYLAAGLAAVINFWIARRYGRGLVVKLVGVKNIEKVDEFTKNYGLKSLILLRLFVGTFHDFISYAYGLTNIRFLPYIAISLLAGIPWLLLWQLCIFERVSDFADFAFWSGMTFIPLFIVSAFFLNRVIRKGR